MQTKELTIGQTINNEDLDVKPMFRIRVPQAPTLLEELISRKTGEKYSYRVDDVVIVEHNFAYTLAVHAQENGLLFFSVNG